MLKSLRRKRYAFFVSMVAGLGLLLGVVYIFDIPLEQLLAVLGPILTMVLLLMIVAFVLAAVISCWRSKHHKN